MLKTLANLSSDPWIAVAGLACLVALVTATGVGLAIALLRACSARQAAEAASAASGQGSILVDRTGQVLKTNDLARRLIWPTLGEDQELVLQGPILELLEDGAEQHHLLRLGANRLIEICISPARGIHRTSHIRGIAVRDVTEQYKGERHLVELAHYDTLTGLGNRRLFIDRLEIAMTETARSRGQLALLYVDLDRFKEVNDTLGHGAGDQLLKTVARRFRSAFDRLPRIAGRTEISVSRLAGDEFAIIVPGIHDLDEAERFATQVLELICEPVVIADRSIAASGSVGIAVYPDHGRNVEDLVKHADSALYAAKDLGRARHVVYEPSFSSHADRSLQIEQALKKAISRGEFALYYQPKVDLATDTVHGFEALLRWHNRELGFVGPKEFIPVAEDRGLISTIGAWCIEETCRQIRTWQDAGFMAVPVSVNISSAQFRSSDVSRIVTDALVAHNVSPSLLEVELTESLLLEEDERTALALRDLRAIGVRVALDDFGTGYSALTYLNRFPLDVVKMDRGFLRDIEDSHAAAGIAAAVISMCHSLGLQVVAEGVDSRAQAALLRTMGCDQIQGFLFSPAVPNGEATRFLARHGNAPPRVDPIVGSAMPVIASSGEATEPEAEGSDMSLAVLGPVRGFAGTAVATARVLVIDPSPTSLDSIALWLMRTNADVHLLTGMDEAMFFVDQEDPALDLVIASVEIALPRLATLMERIRKNGGDRVARLLVFGVEPEASRRESIRQAGVDWVLWGSFTNHEVPLP